jgi:farnesyl-diphosphate farnesyltransferase
MADRTLADDRRYCAAVLPRVSRTFALNIRLLGGGLGDAVRVGYLLCRSADALEDSWSGSPADIAERFDALVRAVEGSAQAADWLAGDATRIAGARDDLDLVAHLPRVWRVFRALPDADRGVVADCVREMAHGMSRYAARAASLPAGSPYLDDESELHDYCYVVAGCVGVMLTRLFAPRAGERDAAPHEHRLALAPVVGEALQLTNILLDWPSDVRRGRCFVPAEWLRAEGLTAADLVERERPGARRLAGRLEGLARAALARVPDYVDLVPARAVRYRLFCLWPALWALRSLRHARRDPEFPWGPRRPRLPKSELWGAALGSLLAPPGTRPLRRLAAAGAR